jgi:hypothetical protein
MLKDMLRVDVVDDIIRRVDMRIAVFKCRFEYK